MTNKLLEKVRTKAYYVHAVIGILIMLLFGFIPAPGPITPMGMRVVGVFLGMIYLFSFCEICWPALLGIILLPIFGYCSMTEAVSASMGHNVVFLSICAFIITGALNYYGVTEYIARWILSRKILQNRPRFFMAAFYCTITFIGIFTASLAIVILFWAILGSICDLIGAEKGDKFRTTSFVGVMLAFICGGGVAPIKSWQLALADLWGEMVSPLVLGKYLIISLPVAFITVIVWVFIQDKIFKADFQRLRSFSVSSLTSIEPMSFRQKSILIINGATFFLVLFSALLPLGTPIQKFMNTTVGASGLFALGTIVMSFFCCKNREELISFTKIAADSVQWPVILLMASTMFISSAVTDESTGIMEALNTLLTPLFAGKGAWFMIFFTLVLIIVLSNFASNIGMATLLIPIVAPFVRATGASEVVVACTLLYSVNIAIFLPGCSGPASLYHSCDTIPRGQNYKYALAAIATGNIILIPFLVLGQFVF